jgi:hypothetical protein
VEFAAFAVVLILEIVDNADRGDAVCDGIVVPQMFDLAVDVALNEPVDRCLPREARGKPFNTGRKMRFQEPEAVFNAGRLVPVVADIG